MTTVSELIMKGKRLAYSNGHKDAKKKLLSAINRRVEALDPQDGQSHLMYQKFEKLINEIL